MNKEWSELNKTMQAQIKKREDFNRGIQTLISLRSILLTQMIDLKNELPIENFSAIPFINASGYHSKTIAYSLFHMFRIEDIVSNSLIKKCNQIFFEHDYQKRMNATITTTGNELIKQEIADFSKSLKIDALYEYLNEVSQSTNKLLNELSFEDLKIQMSSHDEERLHSLNSVSDNESAIWLISYWCGKDIKGLIQMPFSRHLIMHTEACLRIKEKLFK